MVSGKQLERLLGHITCYVFVRKRYEREIFLWDSVLKELWLVARLLPFCHTNLRVILSRRVFAGDSARVGSEGSFGGYGIVTRDWNLHDVKLHSRWLEKWRYKFVGTDALPAPRELAKFASMAEHGCGGSVLT